MGVRASAVSTCVQLMFVYKKFLGWVNLQNSRQPRYATLLTCRALNMKIAGGSELIGRMNNGEVEVFAQEFRGKEIIPSFPQETIPALRTLAVGLEECGHNEEPCVPAVFFDRRNYYQTSHLNAVWIVSYLEESAARAAYDAGLRSGDDTVNWEGLVRHQNKYGNQPSSMAS